jgi:PAS domain S-box-containing protein
VPETIRTLRAVLDEAPVALLLLERDGTVAWANATFRRWGGAAEASARGSFRDQPLLGGSALSAAVARALAAPEAEGVVWSAAGVPVVAPRGSPLRHVDAHLSAVPAAPGRPARLLLLLVDATERLREHERARLHYEAFLTSTNAIEVTDRAGVLIDVNPAFEATYGYSRAECLGKKPNLVRSRHTPTELYERMWAGLRDPAQGHWSGEIVNRDRWGRERPVFLTVTAVRDDAGVTTHYLGVAVDLTEHKTWERVAAHSDRLASLGQLAAGVAHEINTPLANVMLVAESLRRRASDPWTRGRAETIASQVEVAARIVRGLLDFARRSEPQVARIDLKGVAGETVRFVRGKQSAGVELEEHYPDGPLRILGDRGQLMQVLTNLLLNAYDALEGSVDGRIVVDLRRAGDDAELEVRDNGRGIPLEALPHVFEPFFTTKPEGRGTGLGLAICHGIVQAHGGTIVARNVPGGGASLLVRLPVAPVRGGPNATDAAGGGG